MSTSQAEKILEDIIVHYLEQNRFSRGALLISTCLSVFFTHCKENEIAYVDNIDILSTLDRLVEQKTIKEIEYTEKETPYRIKSLYYHVDIVVSKVLE